MNVASIASKKCFRQRNISLLTRRDLMSHDKVKQVVYMWFCILKSQMVCLLFEQIGKLMVWQAGG